jgi:hypothetical protein
MNLPFSRSWWVEPGRILAGCYPGSLDSKQADTKLRALLDIGIRQIICLQEENELGQDMQPFVDYLEPLKKLAKARSIEIVWQRFPIRDGGIPSPSLMQTILGTLEHAVNAHRPVYIHCWGGHGRTGTVVGCWLVKQGLTGEQALERIRELRQFDPYLDTYLSPTDEAQCEMVLKWINSP